MLMPFHRLSRTPIALSLLLLLVTGTITVAFWGLDQTEIANVAGPETKLERQTVSVLTDLLGEGSFRLYLTVNSRTMVSRTDELKLGKTVVESEQVKRENYAKPLNQERPASANGAYSNEIVSRNNLVEQSRTHRFVNECEIASVRCVVLVEETAWGRVDLARSVLTTTLGVDPEKGDELVFIQDF